MRPHHFGLLHLLLALTVAQNVSQTQQTSTQNATQAQPAVLASPPPLDDLAGCPQWLFDYIRWHKQQRENTSAWRLTWTDENTKGTAGFGDRLRGVVFNVRAAASSDRVCHIVWHKTIGLDRIFAPNHIDWRPLPGLDKISTGLEPFDIFWTGNPFCTWDPPSWLFAPPSKWVNVSKGRIAADRDCGCIFRALFKPTAELNRLIDEEQARVLPNGTTRYAGVHYRVYAGLKGERQNETLPDRLPANVTEHAGFVRTVECIRSRAGNLTVFMAVSDINARRAIKRGLFPGFLGPSSEWALHPKVTRAANASDRGTEDDHVRTFVEAGVLWRASLGFWSPSGFSNAARWMQGKGPESNFVVDNSRRGGCLSFAEAGGPPAI